MRSSFLLSTLVGLSMFVSIANSQEKKKAVDISGTWRYEFDLEGKKQKDTLRLNMSKDGKVTGTYSGVVEKPVEVTSGKVDGDEVSLELAVKYQGMPVKVKYSGKVKGDDILGKVVASTGEGDMDFEWNAKRSVESDDLVGVWELEIDAGDTVLEPTLELTLEGKELKGDYKDTKGEVKATVEKIRVEKNSLKFTVNAKFEGNELKADFNGRAYGDKISGTIEYTLAGNSGEVEFKGKRKAAKKEEVKKDGAKKDEAKPEFE
jgi:hypothetical protein